MVTSCIAPLLPGGDFFRVRLVPTPSDFKSFRLSQLASRSSRARRILRELASAARAGTTDRLLEPLPLSPPEPLASTSPPLVHVAGDRPFAKERAARRGDAANIASKEHADKLEELQLGTAIAVTRPVSPRPFDLDRSSAQPQLLASLSTSPISPPSSPAPAPTAAEFRRRRALLFPVMLLSWVRVAAPEPGTPGSRRPVIIPLVFVVLYLPRLKDTPLVLPPVFGGPPPDPRREGRGLTVLDGEAVSGTAVSSQLAPVFASSVSSWAGCSAATFPLVGELASSPGSIDSTTVCSEKGLSSGGRMHRSNPDRGRPRV